MMRVQRFRRSAACVAVILTQIGSPRAQSAPTTTPDLLLALGRSVPAWEQQLTNVVAEERYVQDRVSYSPRRDRTERAHREIVSDLLLVKIDDGHGLVPFRDVFEVDGRAVRDRSDRLVNLFIHPTAQAMAQARAIAAEGARFNLGADRNVNVPLLVIGFLEPTTQPRFRFSGNRLANRTWRLAFDEVARPTIVRGPGERDMPVRGTIDVDLATSAVQAAEWTVLAASAQLTIKVTFLVEPTLKITVPIDMREQFRDDRGELTGHAVYSHYRRFEVHVTERPKS